MAVIPATKLRDYLLDLDHPVGRSKALFFVRLGFSGRHWGMLELELRGLLEREPAWALPPGQHGQKFQVSGTIRGPWRLSASLVTIWIIQGPESPPRFVTAYPRSKQ